MEKNFETYAGNRFSLRAKMTDQIKRIDALSNRLGAIGDILVSTWGGIMMGIVTIGIGGYLVGNAIMANEFATLVDNLVPIALTIIGTLLIALNVVMTNPSMGSQFLVSLRFVFGKVTKRPDSGKYQKLKEFGFYDVQKRIIETTYKGNPSFMAIYRVSGAVSPVSFKEELEELARLNHDLLGNLEKDCQLNTVIDVQKAKTKPIGLAENATKEMIMKRDQLYKITSNLKHNQGLRSNVILTAGSPEVLQARCDSLENSFRQGLVIDFLRLESDSAKEEFYDVFGEI
ncbi:hypothetical protein ACWOE8_07170 [Enterococcus avium]